MPRTMMDVTQAELAVLQLLWGSGQMPIRHLRQTLYPQGGPSHYATVQKLLERLETKGFVHRDRSRTVHLFSAAVTRDELIARRLRALAEEFCGGSLATLAVQILKAEPLSVEQRQSLRRLIDAWDQRMPGAASA